MKIEYYVADQYPNVAKVRFEEGDIVYIRDVNIVKTDGLFDESATETRIDAVGLGVARKIEVGIITDSVDSVQDEQFYEIKADPSIEIQITPTPPSE
jgi:hypothetical protein